MLRRSRASSGGSAKSADEPRSPTTTSERLSSREKSGVWKKASGMVSAVGVVLHWQRTVETSCSLADLPTGDDGRLPRALEADSRAPSNTSVTSGISVAPVLPFAPRHRKIDLCPPAQLYEEGKGLYREGDFAQIYFELCAAAVERAVERHAQKSGGGGLVSTARQEAGGGFRHLDEYLENCTIMIDRARKLEALEKADEGKLGGKLTVLAGRLELETEKGAEEQPTGTRYSFGPRELLVFTCSPDKCPLPQSDDEAAEVSQYCPAAIRRGGTAADLQTCLIEHETRRFLFIGHAASTTSAGTGGVRRERTLCFTGAREVGAGQHCATIRTAANDDVAAMLGAVSTSHGGKLELVFLNGCFSEPLARAVCAAGVPYVVCWRTRAADSAARIFSCAFFRDLAYPPRTCYYSYSCACVYAEYAD